MKRYRVTGTIHKDIVRVVRAKNPRQAQAVFRSELFAKYAQGGHPVILRKEIEADDVEEV